MARLASHPCPAHMSLFSLLPFWLDEAGAPAICQTKIEVPVNTVHGVYMHNGTFITHSPYNLHVATDANTQRHLTATCDHRDSTCGNSRHRATTGSAQSQLVPARTPSCLLDNRTLIVTRALRR